MVCLVYAFEAADVVCLDPQTVSSTVQFVLDDFGQILHKRLRIAHDFVDEFVGGREGQQAECFEPFANGQFDSSLGGLFAVAMNRTQQSQSR